MGDEAGLATAGGAFEQDGETASKRRLEDFAFMALRLVERKRGFRFFSRCHSGKAHE
jgi:hypothetical protein